MNMFYFNSLVKYDENQAKKLPQYVKMQNGIDLKYDNLLTRNVIKTNGHVNGSNMNGFANGYKNGYKNGYNVYKNGFANGYAIHPATNGFQQNGSGPTFVNIY